MIAAAPLAIGDDVTHLRDLTRPFFALYIGGMGARGKNFYYDLACRFGYEDEAERIQDAYLAGRKDEAAALVPAELVEKTSLIGPHGYVKERLAAYREAGVTTLNVTALAPPTPAASRTSRPSAPSRDNSKSGRDPDRANSFDPASALSRSLPIGRSVRTKRSRDVAQRAVPPADRSRYRLRATPP